MQLSLADLSAATLMFLPAIHFSVPKLDQLGYQPTISRITDEDVVIDSCGILVTRASIILFEHTAHNPPPFPLCSSLLDEQMCSTFAAEPSSTQTRAIILDASLQNLLRRRLR